MKKPTKPYGRQADNKTLKSVSIEGNIAKLATAEVKRLGVSFPHFFRFLLLSGHKKGAQFKRQNKEVEHSGFSHLRGRRLKGHKERHNINEGIKKRYRLAKVSVSTITFARFWHAVSVSCWSMIRARSAAWSMKPSSMRQAAGKLSTAKREC